ncbi:MAG: hypothetical protein ABFD29_07580 [Anaerolineaceae bacterium]
MKQKTIFQIGKISNFLSTRKGLLPLIGIFLVVLNFVVLITSTGWLATTNFFLHLGIILALVGILFAWIL